LKLIFVSDDYIGVWIANMNSFFFISNCSYFESGVAPWYSRIISDERKDWLNEITCTKPSNCQS